MLDINSSKKIQGIAILMMIYHHLFMQARTSSYCGLFPIDWVITLSWFCKICVACYAFCSGFGLCQSYIKKQMNENSMHTIISDTFSRVLKFCVQYWIVFLIFLPFFIWKGTIVSFRGFIEGFFMLNDNFCGGWWYAVEYVAMLLLGPSIFLLIESIKNKRIVPIVVLVLEIIATCFIMKSVFTIINLYIAIFIVGLIISYYGIFDIADSFIKQKYMKIICFCGLLICFFVRTYLTESPSKATFDIIICPLFVFCLYHLHFQIENALEWIGKHSLSFWLCSTAVQTVFVGYIRLLKIDLAIYLGLFVVTMLFVLVSDCVNKFCNRVFLRRKVEWKKG